MKTDPRKACANAKECRLWAFVHDGLSHPLMALSNWSSWSLRFHDFTSHKAWPRTEQAFAVFTFKHPNVDHTFRTGAMSFEEAAEKAEDWFKQLDQEFGGNFSLTKEPK